MTYNTIIMLGFFFVFFQTLLFSVFVKKKNNTISLSIPAWVMLLWLFKGGVDFSLADSIGVKLRYERELFSIKVDLNYLLSYLSYYVYYLSYIIVCTGYVIFSNRVSNENSISRIFPRKNYVFWLCLLFVLIYLYYGVSMFRESLGSGLSVYHYSRFNGGSTKSLMTLVSWLSVACGVVGVCISSGRLKWTYLIALLVVFLTSAVLGNRHILLSGVIFYFILTQDTERYNFGKIMSISAIMLILMSLIMSIYVVREASEGQFSSVNSDKVSESVVNALSSSEFIYSHMSMYGVIANDVEPKYGQSLIFLLSATLPRVINNSREDDVYTYYINEVNNNPFKGFSIANPTGWYLNFGAIGLLLGGAILALVTCALHRGAYYSSSSRKLFFLLAFSLFVSDSIGFMRSGGPEPLRAVFLIKSVIPALIIYLFSKYRFKF